MKNKIYLYICAFGIALAGLLSGYDTGVISGALLFIKQSFEINSIQLGIIVSSVSLGAVVGALINSFVVDRIGRKNTLILSAIFFAIGSIISSLAQNCLILIIGRIILGVAVGIVSFVAPLYLSEISSKDERGKIVSLYQLMITFGILMSYICNYYFSNSKYNWRIMLGVGFIIAIVLFIFISYQSDTPRWLVMKNKEDEARKVLNKFNSAQDENLIIKEIKEVLKDNIKINITKKLFKPLLLGIGIMFVQIATGINAIIYYTPSIFKMVGFDSDSDVLFLTILIGVVNFLMTFVAIAFVDKLGRKPLLYTGLSGMTMSLILLSVAFIPDFNITKYISIIACCIYIVSFSMSLGPIALLLISEIFPLRYRAFAMGISIVSNFIFNFVVTALFPIGLDKIGGCYTFLIFAIITVLSIFFVYFLIPETKNITLEELENKFNS